MSMAARLGFAALLAMVSGCPALAYDAGAGQAKAEALCAACHGKDGRSQQAAVPSLAGQHNDYIVLALYQFRAGHRPSALMAPIAATLTDTDLGNLAAYYSALKPWGPERSPGASAGADGPALTQQLHCVQCHGPGLAGQDSVPRIAGQKIDYLTAQLRAFRAGNRGDIDGNMTSAASQLTDGEIDTLADYVSGLATP
jgi:cytochrome c553